MIRLQRLTAAALCVLVLCSGRPSWASDPGDPPVQQAAEHFERGVRLYEEQDWRAALIEFERAYALIPRFQVLFNVAQCRYQLKDYAGARGAFERYLGEAGGKVAQDERDRVQATIEDLRGRVAQVRVETDASGAEITVDDVLVGTTPLPTPILLSEGRRKIAANRPGHEQVARFVDIAGRDSIAVKLVLGPLATPEMIRVTVRPPKSGKAIAPAVAAFGLGAAGVGVGTAFGLVAIRNKSALDLVCSDRACPPTARAQIDTLRRNAVVSTIGFSAGALGIGAGVAFLVFASSSTHRDSGSPPESGRLFPFFGPGLVGAAGSF
jgi:hypothetical protein